MREDGRLRPQRAKKGDLHGGVGDVVRASDDMADPQLDVVHDRGEGVERVPVGA